MFIKLNTVLQLKLFIYIDKSQRKDEQKNPLRYVSIHIA